MKRPWIYLPLVTVVISLNGCPSGYVFKVEPGAPMVTKELVDTINSLADTAEARWEDALYPLVHSEAEPERANLDLLSGQPTSDAKCRSLRPVLSFVHISDAQLKERPISLDRWRGDLDEKIYDHFVTGTERHPELEKYDHASLLATVLGVNELAAVDPAQGQNPYDPCPKPLGPQFVIHTGDAVDAGMFSELFQFVSVVTLLDIPFYNVIGNHDLLFFGTFPADAMKGHNVVSPFIPIHNGMRFMRGHSFEATRQDIAIPFIDLDPHTPTVRGRGGEFLQLPKSHYHGFDLACTEKDGLLCSDAKGYYAVDMATDHTASGRRINIRLIALLTSDSLPTDKGEALSIRSRGYLKERQLEWLAQQLARTDPEPDLILVAGHHPIGSFMKGGGERLRRMLTADPRVIAYVTGHTHVNEIRRHSRGTGRPPLWEIVAGSTLGYPQFGLLVELMENATDFDEYYIRVRTFRQDLGDSVCPTGTANEELPCLAQRARLGAKADTSDGAWRSDSEAVAAANGMLRVSLKSN